MIPPPNVFAPSPLLIPSSLRKRHPRKRIQFPPMGDEMGVYKKGGWGRASPGNCSRSFSRRDLPGYPRGTPWVTTPDTLGYPKSTPWSTPVYRCTASGYPAGVQVPLAADRTDAKCFPTSISGGIGWAVTGFVQDLHRTFSARSPPRSLPSRGE